MSRSAGVKTAAAIALLLSGVSPVLASSHREAPNITKMPKVDNTDVYAFRSYEGGRAGFVTLISNFQPDQSPGNGPNYYTMDPNALYEIHIDSNGDAVEDLTYQFQFKNFLQNGTGRTYTVGGKTLPFSLRHDGQITFRFDPDQGEYEGYTVTQIAGERRSGTRTSLTTASGDRFFLKPFDNAGNKTFPDYTAYANQFVHSATIPGCAAGGARVFVGQREEQFAINLGPVFDLVNFVPLQGAPDPAYSSGPDFPGGITQSESNQALIDRKNVTSIAIEVPISCLTGTGNGVIGVWSTASLPQSRLLKPNPTYDAPDTQGGAFVQVSRLGMPLVNELVIGLPQKDLFNAVKPTADAALADYVTNPTYPAYLDQLFRTPVRGVIGGSGTIAPTNFPRNDLVATFLTGIASLNQLQTVTASEMLRLNTAVTPTPAASQKQLGVVADDLAGFPNGRRPGDDTADIVLRVAMGRLCHPVPINGTPTALGLCNPSDAPTGLAAYTDGAPSSAANVTDRFPYLNPAIRGAPRPQDRP